MNKLKYPGLLLLALACALSLPAAQPGEWSTYSNEKFGYELQYPAGWNVIEARPRTDDMPRWDGNVLFPGVFQKVTFQEPEGKLWPGEFVVLVREHVEGQTLEDWADTNFTDVHDESLVNSVEDTILAGRAARQFSVFGFDQTGIVVALVHDRKIYEISYTGSTPNDPDLAEHGSIYEHMKQSFQLVPSIAAEVFDLGGPCDDGERPTPVAVVHDRPPFVRGEIIFVLDYLGEGFSRYWRNGEIAQEELWIDDVCLRPSRDCWAEYIQAGEDRQEPQWWILIETDEGVRGWANKPEHFGNKDACG